MQQGFTLAHEPGHLLMRGMPERCSHDYVRIGVTALFAALNTVTGELIGSLHRWHRAVAFKKFLTRLDSEVPAGLGLHLVCNNASTHRTLAIHRWLLAHQLLVAEPGRAMVRR